MPVHDALPCTFTRHLLRCALVILATIGGGLAADHPRLLFTASQVPELRARATVEPYASMLARIKADLETDNWGTSPAKATSTYDQVTIALRAGFLYAMTGDDAYAAQARAIIAAQITHKDWANPKVKGLSLYMVGSRVALVYDLCHGAKSWDAAFSADVSAKLVTHGMVIIKSGGAEQNNSPASNWQGARYAAGGLCLLANDEPLDEKLLSTCYERVVKFLAANLGESPMSRGWNSEGLGYTFFPMGNYVGPFGIAIQRHDSKRDIRQAVAATRWSLWTPYAVLSTAAGNIRPDFGDDNPGTSGEGCYGLAFWSTPTDLHPGLAWWYDRVWGAKGNRTYDQARGGTIYSYLFHPGKTVTEADPMTIPAWREAFVDTSGNGFFTFRNRYQDADDAIAQIFAKLRAPGGHSGPDSLSYRIIGLDTAWAVGGGRYGPKSNGQDVYLRSQNTLYPVDPDTKLTINSSTGSVLGQPLVRADGSGQVVLKATSNNVGTRNHIRRFIADHGTSGAEATYVIIDTSGDGTWWQHCTVDGNPITIEGSSFTITGRAGATMRGTFVYPAAPALKVGKRARGSNFGNITDNLFVTAQSADGAYVVVLTTQKAGKPHPTISANGTWGPEPKGIISVGALQVNVDGERVSLPGK